jgi:hypothetical protein
MDSHDGVGREWMWGGREGGGGSGELVWQRAQSQRLSSMAKLFCLFAERKSLKYCSRDFSKIFNILQQKPKNHSGDQICSYNYLRFCTIYLACNFIWYLIFDQLLKYIMQDYRPSFWIFLEKRYLVKTLQGGGRGRGLAIASFVHLPVEMKVCCLHR